MADEAIDYMNRMNALTPDQPWFVYYVPGGVHAPHHPTPEWIKKIGDLHLFDKGWNALREEIFANQKKLGVIPQDAKLTPWPEDRLKRWDQLTDDEKKLFVRQVDVFAAYVAYTDHEIGRVIQAVEDLGKLDNTLVIYINGDNGTSAEGTLVGTPTKWQCSTVWTFPLKPSSSTSTTSGAPIAPTTTWPSAGRGRSILPSLGRSRLSPPGRRSGRAWQFPGPRSSPTKAAFAISSTTSSTSLPRSSKPPAFPRRSTWMESSRARSKV